jgi:signal transduction histidine kinase
MSVQSPPASSGQAPAGISIKSLRKVILCALIIGIGAFGTGVFFLVQRIFDNFGPAVQADLEWKAVRGSRELAQASELGLAANDSGMILEGFGDYRRSDDVVAIVAFDPAGKAIATHGTAPEAPPALIAGLQPGQLRRTHDYYVGLANAEIEGAVIGKIALVISTHRLIESARLLQQVRMATGGAALLALIAGIVFITFFTGAIIKRDAQLADYAATLEKKVDERTAQLDERNQGMRLVLDNVGQGFVTVDLAGVMAAEKSAIVKRWLGGAQEGQTFQDYVGKLDARAAGWFVLGLDQLAADEMPINVVIHQLPNRIQAGELALRVDYTPITRGEKLERLLVVMTDITAELQRQRMEREQRETLALFHAISNDRGGFKDFLADGERLMESLRACEDAAAERHIVHTLKGNAGLFRLESLVQICHDIETRMVDEESRANAAELATLQKAWQGVLGYARNLMGESNNSMMVELADFRHLSKLIESGAPQAKLERAITSWHLEPASLRLGRLGKQAEQLAERLGKPTLEVVIDSGDVRLAADRWGDFWSAFVHVVRNAVDHGIEPAEERESKGKSAHGKLWLTASIEAGNVVIRARDDGRGLDWARLAAKAKERGLPHTTQADLEAAVFADGVSTRDEVTQVSGRGVGMAAVRAAVEAMHGSIAVRSEPGAGTTFEFRFPDKDAFAMERAA